MQGDVFGLVGTTLEGRYRIDAQIGEGGFGVVYRGQHLSLQHPIAIKCLKTPAHFSPQARDAFFAKFREEGQLLSRLRDCPSIVHVYDFGVTPTRIGQQAPYLVLEWLEGVTLEEHLSQRRTYGQGLLSLPEAMALLAPVFDAFAFAHRMKIVHRDIKPANIFLASTARGFAVKVLDFGIAKAMQESDSAQQAATGTGGGFQAFSPLYGSPEQFFSRRYGATGPWTDVHALALMLVEILTGRPALHGEDMAELLTSATAAERPTPRNRGLWVSEPIEAVFAHALAISPGQRYADAEQFYEALRQAMHASGFSVPGPLPSIASGYGPTAQLSGPAQPLAMPAYSPAPTPAALGVWQQPSATALPPTAPPPAAPTGYGTPIQQGYTAPNQYGNSIPQGYTTPAPGGTGPAGYTEQAGYGAQAGYTAPATRGPHASAPDIARGTEIAPGGSTSVPWTSPTPPVTPPPAPSRKSSGAPVIAAVLGLLVVGGGLAGVGVWWSQQPPSKPQAASSNPLLSGPPQVEWARWIEEGRDVFGQNPLTEQERQGRWHYRITRQGGQARQVEKISPSGATFETARFEYNKGQKTKISLNNRGVEQLRTVYQEDGHATTTQRSGEVTDHGCARVQYVYGKSGDIEERRCLSPTGVPVTDEEGCLLWRYTYDGDHRRLSSGCFHADDAGQRGRPAENKEGYHLVKFQYDITGARVREQFFDATGAPVARHSDGCYGSQLGYDGAGNNNAVSCLDATGALMAKKGQQASTMRWDFDGNGCVVRQSYQDVAGIPARLGEIAFYQVSQDAFCNMLSVSLHAANGALTRDPTQGERVALLEHDYNERNDRVATRCYDDKRKPQHCGGFNSQEGAMTRMEVDERGRVTSRKHFYLDGRPSANPGGYPHETRMTYGEDGRLATQTFLSETGAFATALGPVGRMSMRYDAMGNLLSQTFLGVTGVPVESSIGCHEVRFTYDPRNRLSSIECRSTAGELKTHKDWRQNGIDWPPGTARMVVDRGEMLANVYSAPDGRVVKRVECKKLDQLCYR